MIFHVRPGYREVFASLHDSVSRSYVYFLALLLGFLIGYLILFHSYDALSISNLKIHYLAPGGFYAIL